MEKKAFLLIPAESLRLWTKMFIHLLDAVLCKPLEVTECMTNFSYRTSFIN